MDIPANEIETIKNDNAELLGKDELYFYDVGMLEDEIGEEELEGITSALKEKLSNTPGVDLSGLTPIDGTGDRILAQAQNGSPDPVEAPTFEAPQIALTQASL